MSLRRTCLALLLALPTWAHADWGDFEIEFESERPWQEIESRLPAYPKIGEAQSFYVSAATNNDFFIDPASVSVGEDKVVRYTLIVRSSQGTVNVTFEGMRCGAKERKIYAFGRADGSWSKNRYPKWERIQYQDRNRHHHMLYNDFFCPRGNAVGDAKEAVDALKRGVHPLAY